MIIFVDADACPVKKEVIQVAKEYKINVEMFFDTSHQYEDGYSTVTIVDKGADSVDLALINKVQRGDIVVTQDFGVAALALAKGCYPIDQFGFVYTDFNIEAKLSQRAHSQKLRKAGVRTKGPRKREKSDNSHFLVAFRNLIQQKIR